MKWVLSLLGISSGPAGWLAVAASWAGSAWKWVLKNWKLVLSLLAIAFVLGTAFTQGVKWERSKWEKAEAARLEHEREVLMLRKRAIGERDTATDNVEKKSGEERVKREVVYRTVEKEVVKYVEEHSKPAQPGACPTDTDIGDDGLRLIERVRAAGASRAVEGH